VLLIEAKDLSKTYYRGSVPVHALRNVSFEVQPGERICIFGKSGSGKSTLLNILAGLDRPTSGTLRLGDVDLSDPTPELLDTYRQRYVGIVFQQFRLIRHKTARQNIAMPLLIAGKGRRERKQRVEECLRLVGLTDRANHRPPELSGGEQQRVAVARAIANSPPLVLADEPTGNLDSENAEKVMQLLIAAQRTSQSTLVLITHDRSLAESFTDRILSLRDGELVSETRTKGVAL
jgi:putative ABC transport system ATP-binding protein